MKSNLFSSAIIALGLALAGFFVYLGITAISDSSRRVTVKGLSVREVEADYVVWPLNFSVNGNDLQSLYRDVKRLNTEISTFFLEKGFTEAEIKFGTPSVNNNWDSYYGNHRPEYKYTISSSIIISTPEIHKVIDNQGCQTELLAKGVVLSSSDWSTDYRYDGLSELKPSMIEEATKNARAVARKFADDADCRLGSIANASQGQFSVTNDEYRPWIKHVRVVTTVEYYLR